MNLSTKWRPFSSLGDYAKSREELQQEWGETVREARLEVARGNRNWTEVEETALVRRGPFLVHADTDEIFSLRRGEVFEPDRATIGYIPEATPMRYFVNRAGEVVFLERQPGTWSDIVARKARKAARA